MNDMTVGMENLPNIFIDNITIIGEEEVLYVKVSLSVYDDMDNKSWKDRDLDIKVKIVFESRASEIQALNNGEKSLHNYSPSPTDYSTTEPFDTFVFSLNDFSTNGADSRYKLFVKTVEYVKPLRNNLNIYAACFIDNTGFNNHPVFSKFYGPTAAEKIFEGGQVNELSNYFYYPDTNEEYGGPVHQKPNGSYMEGSQHSNEPHKDVVLVTEENYKIQAYNVDFDIGLAPEQESALPDSAASNVPSSPTTAVTPTGVPTPGGQGSGFVVIEDPNVPDSTPDRIY